MAELVAYAKANPGKLNYSTGGIGTLPHLAAELFKKITGTNIVHVPYKGGGPALTGVVAGEVQMTFDTGRDLLAVDQVTASCARSPSSGRKRVAELPDVPTMLEIGYPSFTVGAWTALLAPKARRPPLSPSSTPRVNQALEFGADEKHARQARRASRAAARPQAARRSHGGRNEKVEADRRGARFESRSERAYPGRRTS